MKWSPSKYIIMLICIQHPAYLPWGGGGGGGTAQRINQTEAKVLIKPLISDNERLYLCSAHTE